jgi:hypothetical protein
MKRTTISERSTLEKYALEIFSSDAYLTVNKNLLIYYGPDVAIFLSNLIDKYRYFKNKKQAVDGWFYLKHEQQIDQTGLTLFKIQKGKSLLIEDRVLEITRKGLPSLEYYRLHLGVLIDRLEGKVPRASPVKTQELDIGKSDSIIRDKEPKFKEPKDSNESITTIELFPYVQIDMFPQFWELYPKKAGKGDSLISWKKVCKLSKKERPTFETIKTALQEQKKTLQWQDKQFIPNAETWLNNKRWLNDSEEMDAITKSFQKESQAKRLNVTGSRQPGLIHKVFDREV